MSEFPPEELLSENESWLNRPLNSVMQMDWEKAIYAAFILIAIISRFYGLGDRAVSHDESLHTQYSYQYFIGDGYQHTPLMHGPFLFHATAASYWLFGDNDFSSRIPVAILGVLLILAPWFLRSYLGRKGALFASFFLLVSPYIVYYSRYIRHDIYVIAWALIVFIATIYYLREPRDSYLWWFAGGTALMFATKEVSFIYVATFGSFLIVRLLLRMTQLTWTYSDFQKLRMPIMLLALGVVVLGGSFFAVNLMERVDISAETVNSAEAISAESELALAESDGIVVAGSNPALTVARYGRTLGLVIASLALFLAVKAWRPRLSIFPEFDLIILYAALILPTTTALLSVLAGLNPIDYNVPSCDLITGVAQSPLQSFFAQITTPACLSTALGSPIVVTSIFMVLMTIAGLAIGYWWGGSRFFIPAIIFHVIFALFYTSLFTNNAGWYSGMVGSLGYWLEQQEVARGGQPPFYYLFVTPFYEFMPILFSLLGIRLWMRQQKISGTLGYWISILLLAALGYSFSNWLTNRPNGGEGFNLSTNLLILALILIAVGLQFYRQIRNDNDQLLRFMANAVTLFAIGALIAGVANLPIDGAIIDPASGSQTMRDSRLIGVIVAAVTLLGGFVYFKFVWLPKLRMADAERGIAKRRLNVEGLTGFVPHVIWWLLVTWGAYSYAGEKMPWLSTHIVIPTAILAGWYLGQQFKSLSMPAMFSRRMLSIAGLSLVLMIVAVLTIQTVLIEVDPGSQSLSNLTTMGALFGRIATIILLVYLMQYVTRGIGNGEIKRAWMLGLFALLSVLTIRFSYMANFVNGDYSNEYLVYAHGSPTTKGQVMRQLDEIAMRLEGDKTIRVSFDNKSSWPYYWYLREYNNQHFFGENPDASITDSPVIIAGSTNWDAVENIIRDDYEESVYHYIWWPMEEYRQLGWGALFGTNGNPEVPRGLGSREVRAAMWDIFFYRDYEQYGNVFGGNYGTGQWPLRSDLKMYIRKDVLAKLWDSGATVASAQGITNPYAEGEVAPVAEMSFGSNGSAEGQLNRPRNAAVSPNGQLYVADTGNHRIQVFNPDSSFAFGFGEPVPEGAAAQPGQFNEPWGIAIDGEFVYVADTWNGRIQKFSLDGVFISSFGTFDIRAEGTTGELLFYGPRSIAVQDGRLYIMDTGNHRIQVVDTDGNFVAQVGTNGFTLGQFNEPVGLALDPVGNIYVAEAWSERIQAISNDLIPLNEWRVHAWDGNSLDNKPYIAIDSNSRIYTSDPEGHQVLIFNQIGEYLGRFGRFGNDLSTFDLPTGLTVDAANNVYIVDTNNSRVLKFAPIDLSAQTP